MAVNSLGFLWSAENSSFKQNARYCPQEQYGYDEALELVVSLRLDGECCTGSCIITSDNPFPQPLLQGVQATLF